MAYTSFDPWRQKEIAAYSETSDYQLGETMDAAVKGWNRWKKTPVSERCMFLVKLSETLTAKRDDFAATMAKEMGKPLKQGLQEVDKCALLCRYYADNAGQMTAPEKRASSVRDSYIFYEPQGIILGIMPWNFPFWQVFRFMVPVIAGGNVAILKHSSNVSGCAVAINDAVRESGFPKGVFSVIFPSYSQVAGLISNPLIRGISLTGSNSVGEKVAAEAGRRLKKVVMELGGSDPFIICHDADIEKATDAVITSRFQNCGQSCIAAKRIIVHVSVYESFRDILLQKVKNLRVGDPLDLKTEVGPMVSVSAADDLDRQLKGTLSMGARLLYGGRQESLNPAVFLPSLVEEVPALSPLAVEEVFGPVAPLFRFTTTEEAIMMANSTPFGLGATIWTSDEDLALSMAHDIDTGTVAINGFVKSEPGLPFGGVKESGFGRELSLEGIREFLNIKTVNIF